MSTSPENTLRPAHAAADRIETRPSVLGDKVWLSVTEDVLHGQAGALLTTDEAVTVANNLLAAARAVTQANDPAYKIQAVFNEVFRTQAQRPDVAARALAEAGYRLVEDGERSIQAGPPHPDGESGIGQSGTDVRTW